MKSIFEKISDAQKRNISCALCTIVSTRGSTPRKVGAKMLVFEDISIYSTIGGGDLEKKVIENALSVLKKREAKVFKHDLLNQHDMCCGGTVEIFIEPILKKNKLYIFGAGHTGQALAKFAVNFGFDIFLIDDRKEYLESTHPQPIPKGGERASQVLSLGEDLGEVNKMNLPHQQALPLLPFDENTFICIMTYSHPMDREILSYCIKKPFAYLGMIGSQRKVEMTKKMFVDAGVGTKEELEKIDMPMGFDIAAEGPDEIAVSILAKLIEVKNVKKVNS
ncbi:MAG: XdhC family protein [Bacteroidia bacterium]